MPPWYTPPPRVPSVTSSEIAAALAAGETPFLLDVREPEEWQDAHIEQATLIPLGELGARLGELPRDREIVCVCRSGQRSAAATQALVQAGYDAKNLTGGMLDWVQRDLPTVWGMPPAP